MKFLLLIPLLDHQNSTERCPLHLVPRELGLREQPTRLLPSSCVSLRKLLSFSGRDGLRIN